MIPVVLAVKPSGLRLVRLGCGCQLWARLLPGGHVHMGRRVHRCSPHGCTDAATIQQRTGEVLGAAT